MDPRLLLLETSHRAGFVALAEGDAVVGTRRLDEARRHARDLVPSVGALLSEAGWSPSDLAGVVVGVGPGSYTGLRVGVMSAKALAYATGCALVGVETFAAIARQSPPGAERVAVLADGQQDKVYVQVFSNKGGAWSADAPLAIVPLAEWLSTRSPETWAIGPGLETFAALMPADVRLAPRQDWSPRPESVLALGLSAYRAGRRDDPFALEPLYLRPSSAEELWAKRRG